MNYETMFPKSAVREPLEPMHAAQFFAFARLAHDFGFDWWHADHTACWGRKEKGKRVAKIRLGRLLTNGRKCYVTVSVSRNGKPVIGDRHGAHLASIGKLHKKDDQDFRYLVPLELATGIFDDAELLRTMRTLAAPRETGGHWESDYDEKSEGL